MYSATKHHDLEYSNESLLCFGHGDGGGGPTPEMLERLRRVNDVVLILWSSLCDVKILYADDEHIIGWITYLQAK